MPKSCLGKYRWETSLLNSIHFTSLWSKKFYENLKDKKCLYYRTKQTKSSTNPMMIRGTFLESYCNCTKYVCNWSPSWRTNLKLNLRQIICRWGFSCQIFFIVSSQVFRNLFFFGRAPEPKNLEFSASFDIHDVPLGFYVVKKNYYGYKYLTFQTTISCPSTYPNEWMRISPMSNYRNKIVSCFSIGEFLGALGSGIGTGLFLCHSFSFSDNVINLL